MIDIYDEKRGIYGTVSSLRSLAEASKERLKKGDRKGAGDYAELGFEMWARTKK